MTVRNVLAVVTDEALGVRLGNAQAQPYSWSKADRDALMCEAARRLTSGTNREAAIRSACNDLLAMLEDCHLRHDIAKVLSCNEVETVCAFIEAVGADDRNAQAWRESHAMHDEEGEAHWDLHCALESEGIA